MNAKENRRSILVGIFVFIGIVILLVGILMLGGQQSRFSRTIVVSTQVKNVEGLQPGSNVWFSGVKVGTVKSVEFKGLEAVEIVLAIEAKSQEYIRKDALAKVGSDGLIGNKIIVIEGGSSQAARIEDGDVLAPSATTGTDELMSTLQVNNTNLVGITGNLKELTDKFLRGEGPIGAILTDSMMAVQLVEVLKNLNATTRYTSQVASELANTSRMMNKEGGLFNDILTDTVVFRDIEKAVSNLQGVTITAQALMTNLESVSNDLDREDNVLGVLLKDEESAVRIKQMIESLESSSEKLDENLEALQHNFLFRGFFKKKAREEREAAESK